MLLRAQRHCFNRALQGAKTQHLAHAERRAPAEQRYACLFRGQSVNSQRGQPLESAGVAFHAIGDPDRAFPHVFSVETLLL